MNLSNFVSNTLILNGNQKQTSDMEGFRVLAGHILVNPQEGAKETAGGIIIPETLKTHQQKGIVVLAGTSTDKELMEVKAGDTVLFSKGVGRPLVVEQKDHLLMRQRDILMYVPK